MRADLPARNFRSKHVGGGGEEQAATGWREVSHVRAFVLGQRDEASVENDSLTSSVRDLRYMNKIENIFFGNVDERGPTKTQSRPAGYRKEQILPSILSWETTWEVVDKCDAAASNAADAAYNNGRRAFG